MPPSIGTGSPDNGRQNWSGARLTSKFQQSPCFLSLVAASRVNANVAAHQAGRLSFFGDHAQLTDARTFAAHLAPLRKAEWVVYAKRPFGGPEAVLAYLSRYTHRIAIANSRLIAFDQQGVTFRWKDYRLDGRDRYKRTTLASLTTEQNCTARTNRVTRSLGIACVNASALFSPRHTARPL